ncbi:MAG: DUF1800 family protein [Hyphomicrobiaceae bacterium]|nr:MAG: DUF1800 family protein [Hyphomicrobiaceae bacterium]
MGGDPKTGFVALNRFAFGARGGAYAGDLARAASDPRGFLKAELLQPGIAELRAPALPDTKTAIQSLFAEQERQRIEREKSPPAPKVAAAPPTSGGDTMMAQGETAPAPAMTAPAQGPKMKAAEPPVPQRLLRADAMARFQRAVHAPVGFVERLVHFWSNHFCVSAAKGGIVRATAGCFEREAIRPHVLGRFADMLKAVESHPAMLFYLDNAQSLGPNSKAGQNRKRGLNENLAREILELHTLGVDGGYTQADVTALARIITGWTFTGRQRRIGEPGTFVFVPAAHEPGDHTVLGKVYEAGGIEQGEAVLADLARHPATARHLAWKLARHFVADDPPKPLTEHLAKVFANTGGDLKAVAVALIDSDEAWSAPLSKMRTPEQFLLAALRAIGRMPEGPGLILGPLNALGMPLWQPPGPNGWPDTAAAWTSPEGIKVRLDVSAAIAGRMRDLVNPSELLETIAGEAASRETRQAVARAESRQQGLALLLMSPEFQRR